MRSCVLLHVATGAQRCSTHSQCLSSAPKVHIAPVSEAQCLQTILTGMPLLLECEVSASDATVQWFKDGNPVDHDIFTVQSEGCIRRLLVHSACPLDSGTYTCNTADDTVDFTVMVDGELSQRNVKGVHEASPKPVVFSFSKPEVHF